MSKTNYSFEQWCVDNNRRELIDRWDCVLNDKPPSEISFKSNKKYWFKCPIGIHDSQLQSIQYITSGRSNELHCTKCRSFAQHTIDEKGEEYFNKIWNESNTLDPWMVTYKSTKMAIFNCINNPSHVYDQSIQNHFSGSSCPYCLNRKINKDNSLGVSTPKILPRWSVKNNKTPYEYAPQSTENVWWKCENGIHEDYQRSIARSFYTDFKCPKCSLDNLGKNRMEDLTGNIYGKLTVLYRDETRSKEGNGSYWVCLCECGATKSVAAAHLKNGSVVTCSNKAVHFSGENSTNWKGGITPKILSLRTSTEYDNWRDAVYKKDWYTCQCCGRFRGIKKQAHHLLNFSENEDLRYDINNGILLCNECHYTTIQGSFHNTYGTKNNTPEQLEEYINNKRKELGIAIPFTIESYLNGNILKPEMIKF